MMKKYLVILVFLLTMSMCSCASTSKLADIEQTETMQSLFAENGKNETTEGVFAETVNLETTENNFTEAAEIETTENNFTETIESGTTVNKTWEIESADTEKGETALVQDDFFDFEKSHQPTDEEMKSVKKGMSFYDVVALIGKPHSPMEGVGVSGSYVWITVEGNAYKIKFVETDDIPSDMNMSLSEYNKYTIAYNDAVVNADFFDYEKSHLPTDEEMKSVKKGMSFYDVVALIGKPHGYIDGASYGLSYKWVTVEGNVYEIKFVPTDDVPKDRDMSLSEYNQYTKADNDAVQ